MTTLHHRSTYNPGRITAVDAARAVHVHWFDLQSGDLSAALRTAAAQLTTEERERLERFRFERSRREFLIGRWLLRAALSVLAGRAPESWVFRASKHGRLEVHTPADCAHFKFNLSHSGRIVTCVVADGREVGIDVEALRHVPDALSIAESFFSTGEAAWLRSHAARQRCRTFLDLWTHKEAYLKARGLGLSVPLKHVWFEPQPDANLQLRLHVTLADSATSWQFERYLPIPDHLIAVAIRRYPGEQVQVRVHGEAMHRSSQRTPNCEPG